MLVVALGIGCDRGAAIAQNKIYTPIPLTPGNEVSDRLSDNDIPTGQGNFARDYSIQLQSGDQVSLDLSSDNFDTIVTLLTAKGETVAENDDGPDGTTNSLLFTRITKPGNYVVRVKAFGETPGGPFKLKLTKLKPMN
ncbi:MAG: PPC domain-containing protein [Phormidesmis sp. CAN_BIN36]|nr:PPC domain-containing protein [Phormidesmis sp. CAN_BIN36]